MIDRAVLANPEKSFDFFNDYKDTMQWLGVHPGLKAVYVKSLLAARQASGFNIGQRVKYKQRILGIFPIVDMAMRQGEAWIELQDNQWFKASEFELHRSKT